MSALSTPQLPLRRKSWLSRLPIVLIASAITAVARSWRSTVVCSPCDRRLSVRSIHCAIESSALAVRALLSRVRRSAMAA